MLNITLLSLFDWWKDSESKHSSLIIRRFLKSNITTIILGIDGLNETYLDGMTTNVTNVTNGSPTFINNTINTTNKDAMMNGSDMKLDKNDGEHNLGPSFFIAMILMLPFLACIFRMLLEKVCLSEIDIETDHTLNRNIDTGTRIGVAVGDNIDENDDDGVGVVTQSSMTSPSLVILSLEEGMVSKMDVWKNLQRIHDRYDLIESCLVNMFVLNHDDDDNKKNCNNKNNSGASLSVSFRSQNGNNRKNGTITMINVDEESQMTEITNTTNANNSTTSVTMMMTMKTTTTECDYDDDNDDNEKEEDKFDSQWDENNVTNNLCPICLDMYKVGEIVSMSSCSSCLLYSPSSPSSFLPNRMVSLTQPSETMSSSYLPLSVPIQPTMSSLNNNTTNSLIHHKNVPTEDLPCHHVFHHSCIKEWLLQHDSCPSCRVTLVQQRYKHVQNSHHHGINPSSSGPSSGTGSNRGFDPSSNRGKDCQDEYKVSCPRGTIQNQSYYYYCLRHGVARASIDTTTDTTPDTTTSPCSIIGLHNSSSDNNNDNNDNNDNNQCDVWKSLDVGSVPNKEDLVRLRLHGCNSK